MIAASKGQSSEHAASIEKNLNQTGIETHLLRCELAERMPERTAVVVE
jgi:hypothetical protein